MSKRERHAKKELPATAKRPVGFTALATFALLALAAHPGAAARVFWGPPPAAAAECQGDACAQVAVTFDEAAQQYRAQNNSADRWARVEARNVAASAAACVAPGKAAPLTIRSIVGSYRADYAEARCGAP